MSNDELLIQIREQEEINIQLKKEIEDLKKIISDYKKSISHAKQMMDKAPKE
ncbi:MAG: hypothetical protein IJX99_09040 [Clostridia bacterium]|nr:hypothetical protein [Clostridia bacterium]